MPRLPFVLTALVANILFPQYFGGVTASPFCLRSPTLLISTPDQLINFGRLRINGKLVQTERGCLLMQTVSGNRLLILWPPETYIPQDKRYAVAYRSLSLKIRSKIELLGLVVDIPSLDTYNGKPVPKDCNAASVIIVSEDGIEL